MEDIVTDLCLMMIGVVHYTDHDLKDQHKPEEEPPVEATSTTEAVSSGDGHSSTVTSESVQDAASPTVTNAQGASSSVGLNVQNHLFRPATILIVGDSFIRRVKEYATRSFGPYHNLGIDYDIANVVWYGVGGLTIRGHRNNHQEQLFQIRPDIVYIHLGSNDLTCSHTDAEDLGALLEDLVDDFLDGGAKQIVVSQLIFRKKRGLPRSMSEEDYNHKISVYNYFNKISYNANASPEVRYWYHRGLWNEKHTSLTHDGVHLNSRGNRNFLRSIRGGILQAINRARPQLRILQAPQPVVWEF